MPAVPPARDRLLARLSPRDGPLHVGGVPAAELAERFGTPLFVYDAGILRQQLAAVQAAFGARVRILFAIKANPCVAVAAVLGRAGAGADVASAGELAVARAAGIAAEDVQFAGPGKTAADFAAAFAAGLGCCNLESAEEYEALAAAAAAAGVRPGVAIRVNPPREAPGSRVRMGGGSKKFGVDAAAVAALAERIAGDGICQLRGLHTFAGSQNADAAGWLAGARALAALAAEVEQAAGVPITSLNLGGGFAVPTFDADAAFDLETAGAGLQRLLEAAPPGRAHFVELGRYLCAEAGVYLTRVLYRKESHGRAHAIVDGGLHHFAAAAGFGAVLKRPYPLLACAQPRGTGPAVSVGGPLCTPADELGADVPLPRLAAGDLLAVLLAGAYGLTYSPTRFLSHPGAAEVLVDGGVATLARRRGTPGDALRDQVW